MYLFIKPYMVSESSCSHEHLDSLFIFIAKTSQKNIAIIVSNPAITTPNSLIAINAATQLPLKLTPIKPDMAFSV